MPFSISFSSVDIIYTCGRLAKVNGLQLLGYNGSTVPDDLLNAKLFLIIVSSIDVPRIMLLVLFTSASISQLDMQINYRFPIDTLNQLLGHTCFSWNGCGVFFLKARPGYTLSSLYVSMDMDSSDRRAGHIVAF